MLFRFLKAESGATAIEYGLIATLIALAIISSVGALGNNISGLWQNNNDRLEAGLSQGAGAD